MKRADHLLWWSDLIFEALKGTAGLPLIHLAGWWWRRGRTSVADGQLLTSG